MNTGLLLTQFAAVEEAAQEGGLAVLGINPLALLLQLVTFVLLFFILKRFAFKAIIKMLEERRSTIDKGVDLGREMEVEKQQLDERVDKVLHQARADADKVIAASHQEAGGIIREAEAVSARKTDALLADAHAKIEEEIERARTGLEKEMLALVAEATEVLIGEKLDAKKDAGLIEQVLIKSRRSNA